MAAKIQAKKFYPCNSSWVHAFILTCDNLLAVWFKKDTEPVPGNRKKRMGGVPEAFCCLYPKSNEALYDLATLWPSPGHFVDAMLYKKMAYVPVQPPTPPFGNCGVANPCCANPTPNTLFATLTNNGTCPCVTGTITLNYDALSDTWIGTGPFGTCGRNITIARHCGPATNEGPPASDYIPQIDITYSDSCETQSDNQAFAYQCVGSVAGFPSDPFMEQYIAGVHATCGCSLDGFTITITE